MNTNSTTFKDLVMWQKAHQFVLEAYRISENFPKHELFGLTSQWRRAAVSIAANEAEGYKRRSVTEKLRFFNIAQGSVEECRYFVILAFDLKYFGEIELDVLNNKLDEASKTLNGYCNSLINGRKNIDNQTNI